MKSHSKTNLEMEEIDPVNQAKYLSLIIDDNLKWDSQVKSMHTKFHKSLAFELFQAICSTCNP